jgi:hypothetical protein
MSGVLAGILALAVALPPTTMHAIDELNTPAQQLLKCSGGPAAIAQLTLDYSGYQPGSVKLSAASRRYPGPIFM